MDSYSNRTLVEQIREQNEALAYHQELWKTALNASDNNEKLAEELIIQEYSPPPTWIKQYQCDLCELVTVADHMNQCCWCSQFKKTYPTLTYIREKYDY